MKNIDKPTFQQLNSEALQPFNPSTNNDAVVKVEGVSKKFTRSLKRSMVYGVKDITRNIIGLSSNSEDKISM